MASLVEKLKGTKTVSEQPFLTLEEIELILTMIKNSHFIGSELEKIYQLVLKLQNQYVKQTQQ